MPETYSNNIGTTLAADIDSVATTLIVQSLIGFPAIPEFRIKIEGELMLRDGHGRDHMDRPAGHRRHVPVNTFDGNRGESLPHGGGVESDHSRNTQTAIRSVLTTSARTFPIQAAFGGSESRQRPVVYNRGFQMDKSYWVSLYSVQRNDFAVNLDQI